jgi:hypothetical protein
MKFMGQLIGQNLGYQLSKAVNQADEPKVLDLICCLLFWNEGEKY